MPSSSSRTSIAVGQNATIGMAVATIMLMIAAGSTARGRAPPRRSAIRGLKARASAARDPSADRLRDGRR